MIAYSYLRFSSPRQRWGDSARRQHKATQGFCQRHKATLDQSLNLADLGVSAFRGKNATSGALACFLEAIEDGRVVPGSVLVIESLDRLSREQILEALGLFTRIVCAGVSIATTIGGDRIYTKESITDNWTQLVVVISELARSHSESDHKSKRVAEAWERKRLSAEKRPLTARCPTWMALDRKAGRGWQRFR